MCLPHAGIFSTELGKSLSHLFLFDKENLYWTPLVGVSLNDQGFSIFFLTFLFPTVPLSTLFLIFFPQELDLKLLTLHWSSSFPSSLKGRGGCVPPTGQWKTSPCALFLNLSKLRLYSLKPSLVIRVCECVLFCFVFHKMFEACI